MNKLNFIHIPKNGGTSLKKICTKYVKFNNHDVNVKEKNNQFIILRNPIDRFISSVYYAIEKWSFEDNVKNLINNGIDTPDIWVQIWSNPNHKFHNLLMKEMLNLNHMIGNKKPKYKWTYCKQIEWYDNPKIVIIMDNYEEELKYLFNKINIKYNIPKKNSTKKKDKYLSQKSIKFLNEYFKEDFNIYNTYKNISIEKRIKI